MRVEILITEELNGSQIKLDKEVNNKKDLYSLLDLAEKCSCHFLPENDLEEFFANEEEFDSLYTEKQLQEVAPVIQEHEEAYAASVTRGGKIERD